MIKFVPNFFQNYKKIERKILDIIFPQVCGICGELNENWICSKCKKRIEKYQKYKLIIGRNNINKFFKYKIKNNDKHSEKNAQLSEIEKNIFYDELLYCFEYKGIIRKLLLNYKFANKSYLSNLFANLIVSNKKTFELIKKYDIIIPVPMDKIKKIKRGYNQTELITNILREHYKIYTTSNILVKTKNTKTQSTLNYEQRQENIKNVFKVVENCEIKNKNVVIFDDICTTGATVNEISKILKQSGVNKILVLVIAKD